MSQISLFEPDRPIDWTTLPILLLIDAHNHLYRHWHSPSPRPVGEAWEFDLGRLRRIRCGSRMICPTHALAIFDGDATSWRHELWPTYKNDRPPRPEGLTEQFDLARQSCTNAAMRHARIDDVEADDLIASYVTAAVQRGWAVLISSNDKDLTQLVRSDPNVLLFDHKQNLIGPTEVERRFGVPPRQIIDLLALAGDSSDNIPGVLGVGIKKAAALLQANASIESLLENLAAKPKLGIIERRILDAASDLRIFMKLTALKTDVPLPYALDELRWGVSACV